MRTLFFLLFVVGVWSQISAQSYKILDHADQYAANNIESIRTEKITYTNGLPTDTIPQSLCTLDEEGRPLKYITYFAGGRAFSHEIYTYTPEGKVAAIHFTGRTTQWDTLIYELAFDKSGLVQSRILRMPSGDSFMDTFDRCNDGYIVACSSQSERNGNIRLLEKRTFDSKAKEDMRNGESTLTYIYDVSGLLLVRNNYASMGKLNEAIHYRYTTRDFVDN